MSAAWNDLRLETSQDGTLPDPFELFLASIGTCAGFYVSRFCTQRGIDTGKLRIRQRIHRDPESRLVERIELEILLPDEFPPRYRDAVARAARLCSVTKHLAHPPRIEITTAVTAPA